ncbi:cell adhesion molecule Dscam2-like [Nymphalis io]|uniref:cell adhesion molecule Dscam2-like n=1 Tax=Inachis io TaxID=171585 RepID=UPI0021672B7D|nr:cell adhesion molecule Dscam2-like [Nymphalis io]
MIATSNATSVTTKRYKILSHANSQLIFLMEPPPRLSFSNSTGASVSCAAHGTPAPTITWLTEDGVPVSDVPGLREALPNGTLWLGSFSAAQYRSDVHAAVYRCRAAGTVGTVLSRDMRLEAVMDVPWEVRVQPTHGVSGGSALMTCAASAPVRGHISVTRWFKDGSVLAPMAADAGGRYMIGGSRGDILVIREARPDDASSYSCEAQHVLTGEKRRSNAAMIAVSHTTGSMAPRILTISEDETVPQGGDIRLVCCAIGSPPPTYSWFRHANGRLSPVSNSIRISVTEQVLVIRRAQTSDSGVWTCRAHNQYGEQRRDARLRVRSRLVVSVHPQLQVANSGSSVTFNCSVEGGEARVRWLHDGVPVGGGERVLRVHGVVRAHRGMYQCFAERDLDSAQAAAELRLGDTAPELHYTFIEQALHPGPALALHCSASGSPPPRFTWLLDMQVVEEHNTPQRSISQFMSPNGDVVSYLNITSVRPEDGGRYTCRAHNTRGAVEHSTRLNVYGPPSIRNIGPVRVVAGVNTTLYCPYSGFPISDIRWQRGGLDVGSTGRALSGSSGELLLWPAEPADAGVYSCRVTAPSGQYAQKDVQIFVRNPPKIAGFSFPADLVEGSSIQVLCGITSGDKPVYFSWLKDGLHIPSNLQVYQYNINSILIVNLYILFIIKSVESESEVILEYRVDGLRPATAYALRLAAVNDIGDSEYSESVIVQTLEEAPSEPPRNVEIQADAPGELLVKWQPPSQESWNGELLGYAIWWRGDNTSLALTVPGWAATHARLASLRAHARYEVRVRAFNAVGAGPSCAPLAATTLEDVPDAPPQHIRCEPLSAQSFRVWWEPPPAVSRGGLLLGYEIMYQEVGLIDAIWERRRAGGGEAQVGGLRAGNYSLQVAARTAAGLGPPAATHCTTLDDVPGPPADIKAVPNSEESVIVSWLAPAQKNGKIRHYTVYNRPQRTGQHSHVMVPHSDEEQMLEVRGLQEHQLYEFWVTAATTAGEGEMSAIVAKKPSSRAGAKIWSFPRRITAAEGSRVVLTCGGAGTPTPLRVWSRRRPPSPTTDPRIRIEGHRIVIPKLEAVMSDNYTCVVRNPWGEERGVWELRASSPPARPRLRLSGAAPAALLLAWDAADSHTSKPAVEKHMITSNSSCVRLNFLTWDSNSCPLIHFVVSIRGFEETVWRSETVGLDILPTALCGLHSATWYHLKVVALSTAGSTTATYYFSTLTEDGERIAAPAQFPAGGEEGVAAGGGFTLLAAAAGLVVALLLLAVLAYRRSMAASCFRKGYEQSGVSEEDKSIEKRDNRRNCQQVYTSSPIKHPNKKEQQGTSMIHNGMF